MSDRRRLIKCEYCGKEFDTIDHCWNNSHNETFTLNLNSRHNDLDMTVSSRGLVAILGNIEF